MSILDETFIFSADVILYKYTIDISFLHTWPSKTFWTGLDMHGCVFPATLAAQVRLVLHDAIFAQETLVSSEDPTLWREITDMEAAWWLDGT